MARSRVTSKYRITIPKEVREKVGVRRGEVVSVEVLSTDRIVLKLHPRPGDLLKTLAGRGPASRKVRIEELEEMVEAR